MAVDPARQFASPYVGMGNNPVSGVDPDGESVVTPTEEKAQQAVQYLEETHPGAEFTYHQIEYEINKPGLLNSLFGRTETKTGYEILLVDGSSTKWLSSGGKYAKALYAILKTCDIYFEIDFTTWRYDEKGNKRDLNEHYGGGSNIKRSSNYALIAIDPRGNINTGEPPSIILLHELIGHNHPIMSPNAEGTIMAHDVNHFYQKKMTGNVYSPYPSNAQHEGYTGILMTKVHWQGKYWYHKSLLYNKNGKTYWQNSF